MSSSIRIEIQGFRKRYKDAEVRIERLCFDARINVLLGGNGSGKTTLLKGIAGLLTYAGDIMCAGRSIYVEERCRFPDAMETRCFLSTMQALETQDPYRFQNVIDHFDIHPMLNKPLNALSKGMKQKINLVVALMASRDVYLLDEPLSGLDDAGRTQMLLWMENAAETFVCATHLENAFHAVCHRMVRL